MNNEEIKCVLACRVPLALKQRIAEFRKKYRFSSETGAILELLQIGLFVDSRKDDLEDPEVVKHLRDHLYDQRVIDWIYDLPDDRLDALHGAFRDARNLRFQHRLKGIR